MFVSIYVTTAPAVTAGRIYVINFSSYVETWKNMGLFLFGYYANEAVRGRNLVYFLFPIYNHYTAHNAGFGISLKRNIDSLLKRGWLDFVELLFFSNFLNWT